MKTQIKNRRHVSHLHFGIRNIISCTHIFPLWCTFNAPSVLGHRFGGQPPPARQQRQSTEQTFFPEKRNPTLLSALERKKPVQLKLNISIQFSNELLLPYILLLRPPFILLHTMARNFFLLRLEQQDLKQQQEEEE